MVSGLWYVISEGPAAYYEDEAASIIDISFEFFKQVGAIRCFVVVRYVFAKQSIRQFVAFSPIRNLLPDSLNQFHRVEREIIPNDFVDLAVCLIIFEKLNRGRELERRTICSQANP